MNDIGLKPAKPPTQSLPIPKAGPSCVDPCEQATCRLRQRVPVRARVPRASARPKRVKRLRKGQGLTRYVGRLTGLQHRPILTGQQVKRYGGVPTTQRAHPVEQDCFRSSPVSGGGKKNDSHRLLSRLTMPTVSSAVLQVAQ